ncbi:plastocyanin/azurin family copper-binding protein [Paraconexibacter antarcticus]|uniref:Plastocyanin/azurin family copper-binding protein n=1 Tax=Paraconexibacter antarcticus TaxID=2949664 RepID=A0ABY5E1H1_9ACTN|nr:plastocyanin/azurin family copper-binding protein [Paraconexibacter antarcticus]UTI66669.1 plastocyanin/azurin family copper-binding protein [Paraconexibacter antarcticus]
MATSRIGKGPILAGAILACGAGLVAGSAGRADAAGSAHVRIKNIDFSPHKLVIKQGTTVRWTFEDAATPHNVTSRGRAKFRSSPSKQSGSYSVKFTKPGTYRYVCTIHFNMKGTIVVK